MNKDYYKGLHQIILKQFNGDATWSDVVNYRKQNGVKSACDYVQRGSAILGELLRAGYTINPPNDEEADTEVENQQANVVYNAAQNSYTYSKIIAIAQGERLTPELVMEKHGLDQNVWTCEHFTSNYWSTQGLDENGTPRVCYQTKITVKPKKSKDLTVEDIKKYFENYIPQYAVKHKVLNDYKDSKELLVPCFFDLHFSKLAHVDEVGERNGNFDSKIAKERFITNAQKYISKLQHRNFEKILFVIGQDFFNSESDGNTINGTKQDNDTRYAEMFKNGTAALIEVINMFSELAPVDVVLVQGNHDETISLYCACVLDAFYRNDENVNVDTSPMLRKYYKYGNTLLGLSHGEYEKNRIYELMQVEAREDWGETWYHEWLLGHLHSEAVTERAGVTVRRIPSLTGTDYWHAKMGFTMSPKRSCAFIYDKYEGLKDVMYEGI